jgi:GNAT superfamily N-acetyltransferase
VGIAAMLTDAELYARARDLVKYELSLFGESSPRSELVILPGVVACVNPDAPDRSLFNGAVGDSPAELLDAYSTLEARYAAAGVRAFMVWGDPGDEALERELALRGHLLDGRPEAMGATIAELSLPPPEDLDWYETRDPRVVTRLNDVAYGYSAGAFASALTRLDDPRWRAYVARAGEHDRCCALTYESELGDCGIACVATHPDARRQGLASRLLSVAIAAAAERGARTSSLQATKKGRGVYERLGFRAVGAMRMWERRAPAPTS